MPRGMPSFSTIACLILTTFPNLRFSRFSDSLFQDFRTQIRISHAHLSTNHYYHEHLHQFNFIFPEYHNLWIHERPFHEGNCAISNLPVWLDASAAADADAGRILETCQAPIHHAPGLRYIAEETPCSDLGLNLLTFYHAYLI